MSSQLLLIMELHEITLVILLGCRSGVLVIQA